MQALAFSILNHSFILNIPRLFLAGVLCTGKYVAPQVYDELEEITGLERNTIQQYKQVADATSCTRVQDLSYSHHREVSALEPEQQKEFLQPPGTVVFL